MKSKLLIARDFIALSILFIILTLIGIAVQDQIYGLNESAKPIVLIGGVVLSPILALTTALLNHEKRKIADKRKRDDNETDA